MADNNAKASPDFDATAAWKALEQTDPGLAKSSRDTDSFTGELKSKPSPALDGDAKAGPTAGGIPANIKTPAISTSNYVA